MQQQKTKRGMRSKSDLVFYSLETAPKRNDSPILTILLLAELIFWNKKAKIEDGEHGQGVLQRDYRKRKAKLRSCKKTGMQKWKSSRRQGKDSVFMGNRVSQADMRVTVPCWTESWSSHKVRAGTREQEGKSKFQGPTFKKCDECSQLGEQR